jgi:hypothetical protein
MIKEIKVTIKGVSPLLMNTYPMVERPEDFKKWSPQEQAGAAEYRTPDGKLYLPGVALQRSFVNAAAYSKGKGRASLQKQVAACALVSPDYLIITPQSYTIDSRRVAIRGVGAFVRHRPRFEQWEVQFGVEFDPALLSEKEIRKIVDDSGSRVGVLDFRPERKGPFGRFMVTSWA